MCHNGQHWAGNGPMLAASSQNLLSSGTLMRCYSSQSMMAYMRIILYMYNKPNLTIAKNETIEKIFRVNYLVKMSTDGQLFGRKNERSQL